MAQKDDIESGLDSQKIVQVLDRNGIMSRFLKDFEPREQQQKMMANVIEAYNSGSLALIEAGTGTGKSMAYLIPALLWALQKKERTVISTHTITLQEQLIRKDIPFISKALNLEVKAVLVKGMRNYVCLRKLEDLQFEMLTAEPREREEFEKIAAWSSSTQDGTRSTLPFVPSYETWDKVCAESDTCNGPECPYQSSCYFFKARRQANEAQILVANHYLLFADLARRAEINNYTDQAVLPPYSRVILDEAHHIEEIATEYFAAKVNSLDMLRVLARLGSEKGTKIHGKLPLLKDRIQESYRSKEIPKEVSTLFSVFNIDLPASRKELQQEIVETFDCFARFLELISIKSEKEDNSSENKLRILPYHQTHPSWDSDIVPRTDRLIKAVEKYTKTINHIENEIKNLNNERLNEQIKGIRFEISALCLRMEAFCTILKDFVSKIASFSKVRWIEVHRLKNAMQNIHLVNAELNIAEAIVNFLFNKFPTIVMCSATLATNKHFDFVKNRLGLNHNFLKETKVLEKIYDSPFDYQSQALLTVPIDMPSPLTREFNQAAAEKIWEIIQISRGNAFVLFTSYSMLNNCYHQILERLKHGRYHPLKQGDDNRDSLLRSFIEKDRSVLFGTDSFWEGVDVVGEALRCVIIVKLPFKVPSEPIIQARTESISAKGGDPFFEYTLPNAIVKFKQGFGRLIRNKKDRGCIVCLDSRLATKGYGKEFLNSLPPCQRLFASSEDIKKEMENFYKYRTKK